jgi:RNA polymerase sigma-70 factor, ECF subfamily
VEQAEWARSEARIRGDVIRWRRDPARVASVHSACAGWRICKAHLSGAAVTVMVAIAASLTTVLHTPSPVWMSAPTTTRSRTQDSISDQGLIAAYRRGDQRAAGELVARHGPALGRFLYGSGAAADEVDDLVQEALFRAFRRLHTWRGEASFRSWLLTIGSNLLKDQYRTRKGRQTVSLEEHEVVATSDPHAELAAGEMEERLRSGLARLPRLQREVFLLRTQQGTDYQEIAIALGTTPGAARVHYHHAVKRLKEIVG